MSGILRWRVFVRVEGEEWLAPAHFVRDDSFSGCSTPHAGNFVRLHGFCPPYSSFDASRSFPVNLVLGGSDLPIAGESGMQNSRFFLFDHVFTTKRLWLFVGSRLDDEGGYEFHILNQSKSAQWNSLVAEGRSATVYRPCLVPNQGLKVATSFRSFLSGSKYLSQLRTRIYSNKMKMKMKRVHARPIKIHLIYRSGAQVQQ